jgi:hypothetical protein
MTSSITPPRAYLDLQSRGALDYWGGRTYGELSKEDRGRIAKERRYLGLWLRDFEWSNALEPTEDPNVRPGLYPFAQNNAGDQYCFFPQWPGRNGEASIVFAPHDEMTAKVYATSFSELLLHQWLVTARWWDEEHDGTDRVEALTAWRAIIESVADDRDKAVFASLSPALDPKETGAALAALEAALPQEELAAQLPPTKYNPKYVKGETAIRMYGQSIASYEQLIAEGHTRFQQQLDEARAKFEVAKKG